MKSIIKQINKYIIAFIVSLLLIGCSVNKPPLEYAPDGKIIKQALQIKLEKQYEKLTKNLGQKTNNLEINQINITKIEPTVKLNLPIYHLTGNYQLNLNVNSENRRRISNTFTLDLQRRKEGKTWFLILPKENSGGEKYIRYQIW